MGLFSKKNTGRECGAVIDIGGGSVGVAIIVSENKTNAMHVVWSHRVFRPIKEAGNAAAVRMEVEAALWQAFAELGNNGVRALHRFNPELTIEHVQVALCAPWSYTVTKTVSYTHERPFVVNQKLIDELIASSSKKLLDTDKESPTLSDLGVRIIASATVDIKLNDYSVQKPLQRKANSIALSHVNVLGQEGILLKAEESVQRILPKATVECYSFMYLFYRTLKELYPDTTEAYLVDITNEATEVGIVHENVLRYTTFAPVGLYGLARKIAAACDIPHEVAYTFVKDGFQGATNNFSKAKQEKIDQIVAAYEAELAALFEKAGNAYSVPKAIFLHTSRNTEEFFIARLQSALKLGTDSETTIHTVTSRLLGDTSMNDTALALSAYYFHTRELYMTHPVAS